MKTLHLKIKMINIKRKLTFNHKAVLNYFCKIFSRLNKTISDLKHQINKIISSFQLKITWKNFIKNYSLVKNTKKSKIIIKIKSLGNLLRNPKSIIIIK